MEDTGFPGPQFCYENACIFPPEDIILEGEVINPITDCICDSGAIGEREHEKSK
jgi:hypothetical protein